MALGRLSEFHECVLFLELLKCIPLAHKLIIHIPNEGKRTWGTAQKLKRTGLKAGVPDYFLPIPTPSYAGLWIEMKRTSGRITNTKQTEWLQWLNDQGYYAAYCFGAEQAYLLVKRYLANGLTPIANMAG